MSCVIEKIMHVFSWDVHVNDNVRCLMEKMGEQLLKPGDDAATMTELMTRLGFDMLPLETQVWIMFHCNWFEIDDPCPTAFVWALTYYDKVETLKAVLPLLPLFSMDKEQDIANKRRLLYDNNVRFSFSDDFEDKDQIKPHVERHQLCAMQRQLSLEVIRRLFVVANHLGTGEKITSLILENFPHMTTTINIPLLTQALLYMPGDWSIIGPKQSIARICETFAMLRWSTYVPVMNKVGNIAALMKGREEEIRQYSSSDGHSLLYTFVHMFSLGNNRFEHFNDGGQDRSETVVYLVQVLLLMGLDPMERVYNEQLKVALSPLDALLYDFFHYGRQCENRKLNVFVSWFQRGVNEAWHAEVDNVRCLVKCAQLLSSALSPTRPSSDICASFLPDNIDSIGRIDSWAALNMAYIGIVQLLPQPHNVFPVCLNMLLNENFLQCVKPRPCQLCESAVQMVYTALLNGSDPTQVCTGAHYSTVYLLCYFLINFEHREDETCSCRNFALPLPSNLQASQPEQEPASCDCCLWQVFQLVVSCIGSLHHVEGIIYELLRQPPPTGYSQLHAVQLRMVKRTAHLLWAYSYSAGSGSNATTLLSCIRTLKVDVSDEQQRQAIGDLEELALSVRPLTLLSRICVLGHIKWKDIAVLTPHLSVAMVHYLQIGDVGNDHPVHRLL